MVRPPAKTDGLPMERCRVSPDLAEVLYILWYNGFTYPELRTEAQKWGFNLTKKQVENCARKYKWQERKAIVDQATRQYYTERMKMTKFREVRALALALDANSEIIEKDYLDYKKNPEVFLEQVRRGERRKPIFVLENPRDTHALMDLYNRVITDWSQTRAEDNPGGEVTNNTQINILTSDSERANLLKLMAAAKLADKIQLPAEVLIEANEVKELVENGESSEDKSES